jgi:8-oxo-dGTP pyrophosphatase MutT (NUDIX family)
MSQSSEKFIQQLHKLRRCEQVAAVCYRMGGHGVEFLLVQTRGGRWTFPKGSTEPGLTHAQAAALEAFEEAGVHGRIEEGSFARYACGELYIHAHLCEVLRLDPPQEFGRDPTWFSARKAKRRLRQGRRPDFAAEISGVIDRAVERLGQMRMEQERMQQQRNATLREKQFVAQNEAVNKETKKDALRTVQFEAGLGTQARMEAAFVQYVRREVNKPPRNGFGRQVLRSAKVLQLDAPPEPNGHLAAARVRRRLP